jgi:hypothetical protein
MKIEGFVEKTPQEQQRDWIRQLRELDKVSPIYSPPCSLDNPLLISIPREGVIIQCEKHAGGHFIRPSLLTYY